MNLPDNYFDKHRDPPPEHGRLINVNQFTYTHG